jgi:hypothetical protein
VAANELVELLSNMLSREPGQRPTMAEVLKRIQPLLARA